MWGGSVKALNPVYTLPEWLAALRGPCTVESNATTRAGFLCNPATGSNHSWVGTLEDCAPGESGLDTLERLIRDGWSRGVELMTRVAADVEVPAPVSIRRRARWTDAGDDLEMQRVYAGDLEHAWRRTQRASGSGPARVRLLVDSLAFATATAESMRWRGVAALVAADLLTSAGYSVQIESVMHGLANGHRYAPSCIVKAYTAPLDLSSLAATTALPAFFRVGWHAWQAVITPTKVKRINFGVLDATAGQFEDDDLAAHVELAGQSISDASAARAWVERLVRSLDDQRQRAAA